MSRCRLEGKPIGCHGGGKRGRSGDSRASRSSECCALRWIAAYDPVDRRRRNRHSLCASAPHRHGSESLIGLSSAVGSAEMRNPTHSPVETGTCNPTSAWDSWSTDQICYGRGNSGFQGFSATFPLLQKMGSVLLGMVL